MIELGKQYKTRDGREARVYAVDHKEPYSVWGVFERVGDDWLPMCWTSTGSAVVGFPEHSRDLIEVKPRINRLHGWCNVYPESLSCHHLTKEIADLEACPSRIACVKIVIDCEEGEGLKDGR